MSPKIKRQRIDSVLVEKKHALDLKQAQALIMSGKVLVDNQVCDKAGALIDPAADLRIKKDKNFSSRAGDKLQAAINHFDLKLKHKICLDIGASTGGFTDCLLKCGAQKVFAVDVGTNQLVWSLRTDSRVVSLEQLNLKDLTHAHLQNSKIDFCVIDVSFISVCTAIESVLNLFKTISILALVKPQFELDKDLIEKGGVVSNLKNQEIACQKVIDFATSKNCQVSASYASPVKGQKKKNQEYFLLISKQPKQ